LVITPGTKHNLFDETPAWTGQASVRYGWPLHVIENAGHFMVAERPEAFLEALRAALGNR
jgi:pimeloyl-ACP methyl ester carboxylesterase